MNTLLSPRLSRLVYRQKLLRLEIAGSKLMAVYPLNRLLSATCTGEGDPAGQILSRQGMPLIMMARSAGMD